MSIDKNAYEAYPDTLSELNVFSDRQLTMCSFDGKRLRLPYRSLNDELRI